MPDLACTPLDDLCVLEVRGPDALSFLQGQLSHDMNLLPARGSLLAALHNPQGRVLALLRLLHLAQDHVLAVLPAPLANQTMQTLAKYVLRAKVKVGAVAANWRVYGVTGPDAAAAASTRISMAMDTGGWRQLVVAPRGETLPEAEVTSRAAWRLADIEAGIPEVTAAISGSFVAQMLNLDLIDAISLDKGCYTGQEVVARAHYLGQVKRRMQRFYTPVAETLVAGERVDLADGRSAVVVAAEGAEDEGQHFLAVTRLPKDGATADADASAPGRRLDSASLPLPYQLPQ